MNWVTCSKISLRLRQREPQHEDSDARVDDAGLYRDGERILVRLAQQASHEVAHAVAQPWDAHTRDYDLEDTK